MIADVIPVENRSKYLSRLDAVISAAYIIGQGIGGLLGKDNTRLPLYEAKF